MIECNGDRIETFERDALPHRAALFFFAVSLAKNDASAEDLVQETMFKAFRSWHRYRSGTNLKGWLFTILRNTFLSEQRRWESRAVVAVDEIENYVCADPAWRTDPETEYVNRLAQDDVVSAIEQLPHEFREAMRLVLIGLSYEGIAQTLGVPVGTVRSRLFRARRRLQQRLEPAAA